MITIQVCYDMIGLTSFSENDKRIEDALRPHCQDLELQGSGAGFGRRDLEFWATAVDPDISFEYALEPLFLNNLDVIVYEGHDDDPDEE